MKTYTLDEYKERLPGGVLLQDLKTKNLHYSFGEENCTCCRFLRKGKRILLAYEDCPNCLGFGHPPITLEDLR